MDLAAFKTSLAADAPPADIELALQALWWDAKGQWDKAHACADSNHAHATDWVHAYLHRKEGDRGNASYWYRRAGRTFPDCAPAEEWAAIARAVLEG